ncbi:MAG TPA: stage II sporulation protein M [Xanthobacteraceae bacterium]|nr:stage II sporulation protein M [Xanthobacteraceae bacterium]
MSIESEIASEVAGLQPGQRPAITLKSAEFRRTREQGWADLEKLIGITQGKGVRALSPDELERMPQLYRATLSSLSVARAIALDRNLLLYLESLSLRAYLALYSPRIGIIEAGRQFLRAFPAAVISARWHVLIAFLSLALGIVAGFWLTIGDESWFTTFVPGWLSGGRGVASTRASLLNGEIFAPWPGFAVSLGIVSNYLFSHNTLVGILSFSLGLFAGVPTVLLLAYQGLTLGAFLALHYNRDLTVDFLGWLSIHGVTELTAIVLFGAGGLVLAEKMLFPDRYSRVDSLALHGRRAAEIAVGAVMMLFVAGILEGEFRQLVASTPWRFVIAAASAVGWLCYLILLRPREPAL